MKIKKIIIFFSVLLIFLLFFVGSLYAVDEEFPPIPDVSYAYTGYVIHEYNGSVLLKIIASNAPLDNIKVCLYGTSGTAWKVVATDYYEHVYSLGYKLIDGVWTRTSSKAYDDYINRTGDYFGYGDRIFHYSSFDIYESEESNEIFFQQSLLAPSVPTLENPTIGNSSTSWDTGIFDYITVYSNDFVGDNWRDFYLLAYDYSTDTEENPSLYPKKVIPIQNGMSSEYYTRTDDDYGYVFMIPTVDLGLSFKNGNNYALKLAFKEIEEYEGEQIEYYDYVHTYRFIVANLTDEEIMQDKQDVTNNLLQEQQEILKEQHNTSKGIFGTIKEILSYLNPFSENFFAYKLVGLILDGLKSLFIPSDGFFETFFEDMKEWFSERLGFLFYPFELIIDILNKILNVNFSEPIFNIPDINEPFTNTKLIGATTYNLNSLLSNSILENVHNIYLIVVDSIIVFALVNLAKRKFEEVTSK